jgi:hypothetical protein
VSVFPLAEWLIAIGALLVVVGGFMVGPLWGVLACVVVASFWLWW